MVFLLVPIGFRMVSYSLSMVFPWFCYCSPFVFLWFYCDFLVVFLWVSYGFPMVSYCFPIVSMVFLLFFYLWHTGGPFQTALNIFNHRESYCEDRCPGRGPWVSTLQQSHSDPRAIHSKHNKTLRNTAISEQSHSKSEGKTHHKAPSNTQRNITAIP